MQSRFVLTASIAMAAAMLFAQPVSAQATHAGHAAHAGHAGHAGHALTQPAPARRWPTDAPLREGMRDICQAVQALEHYEHGHMDATQARNTGKLIEQAVAGIFAHCKLEPDADAALHGLLAKFLAGAKAVRESQQAPNAAIADMRAALARYPQLFDDADWDKAEAE